ncbi:inositol monophosphatase family protein [Haloarchaeobius sp. HRN-SO-5]|uniref:inositol monophosphatase family protein n=1 Tax=Haloarchaeobius sp. HRN-SO-5 TaxID=3446118 RepID=UPI003EB7D726
MTDYDDRAHLVERAARSGAAVAAAHFRTDIPVEEKDGKTDVVTQADRDAQAEVVSTIRDEFPDDAIVGEEEDERKTVPGSGAAWVIDPIDGTNNYVRGIHVWATSVAAVVDGEPVAAATVMPALDDVYLADDGRVTLNGTELTVSDVTDPDRAVVCPTIWWGPDRRDEYATACREIVERFGDMRRVGCAQATLGMVAAGAFEATVTNVVANPWDTVAGVHMVRQAGGTVTDLDGDRWTHDSRGLVASNGAVHDEALAAARAVEGVRTD